MKRTLLASLLLSSTILTTTSLVAQQQDIRRSGLAAGLYGYNPFATNLTVYGAVTNTSGTVALAPVYSFRVVASIPTVGTTNIAGKSGQQVSLIAGQGSSVLVDSAGTLAGGMGGTARLQSGSGGSPIGTLWPVGGNGGVLNLWTGSGRAVAIDATNGSTGGASGSISLTPANGGSASGITATNIGGAIGNVVIGGVGSPGSASGGTNYNTGGYGGTISLTPSVGGSATGGTGSITNTGGAGGAITLIGGNGGIASGATNNVGGAGGSVTLYTGNGGSTTNTIGNGGSMIFQTGTGAVTGTLSFNPGGTNVIAIAGRKVTLDGNNWFRASTPTITAVTNVAIDFLSSTHYLETATTNLYLNSYLNLSTDMTLFAGTRLIVNNTTGVSQFILTNHVGTVLRTMGKSASFPITITNGHVAYLIFESVGTNVTVAYNYAESL